jgi:hypothetical protein
VKRKHPERPEDRLNKLLDQILAPVASFVQALERLSVAANAADVMPAFRALHHQLNASGIPSADPALFDPRQPETNFLAGQALADLMGRVELKGQLISEATARISEVSQQLADRLDIAIGFMAQPAGQA